VGAGLWEELKEALKEALQNDGGVGVSPAIGGVSRAGRPRHHQSARVAKAVSAPPAGEANRVEDLSVADNGDGTYTLFWHYRNLGDYNQDGVVSIADVTPVAIHYGEHYSIMWQVIDEVIDAGHWVFTPFNGVGLIGDEEEDKGGNGGRDTEVLAAPGVFGNTITGYAIFGAEEQDGTYTEFDPPEFIPFSELTGHDGDGILRQRGWFDVQIESRGKRYIKPVPVDQMGTRHETLALFAVDL